MWTLSETMESGRKFIVIGTTAVACLLNAGCEDSPGACPSEQLDATGDQFNLRVYNCEGKKATVFYNDRQVGSLEPLDEDTNECIATDLSLFAQCIDGKIRIEAGDVDSYVIVWTSEAVSDSASVDGCWHVLQFGTLLPGDERTYGTADPVLTQGDFCAVEGFEESGNGALVTN